MSTTETTVIAAVPVAASDETTNPLLLELAKLKAENARLKAKTTSGRLSLRVSAKGAVSVYGMGRFPVTLYREQWTKLFAAADEVKAFIEENSASLKVKGDGTAEL